MGSKVERRLRLFFLVRARGNIWPSSALQSMQNVWEKTCAVCAALGAMPSSLPSLLPSSFSPTANIFAEKSVNPLPPKPFERIFDRPPTVTDSTFLSINGYKSQVQLKYRPPMCRVSGHLLSANQDGVSIQWRSRQRVLLQIRGLIYRVSKRGAAVRLMVISRFHLTLRDPLLRRSLARGVINLGME